jgi:hypothetical protein
MKKRARRDLTVNKRKIIRRFWIATPQPRLEPWRDLGDALHREWRILTRRREITPQMVFVAIAAAGLGWGIAYLVDSLPSWLPEQSSEASSYGVIRELGEETRK